jgi:hypothetical protein
LAAEVKTPELGHDAVARGTPACQHKDMWNEPHHVARINRHELTELPAGWSNSERGHYLRVLLRLKGIDPDRFYWITYHPFPRCWLLTQEAGFGPSQDRETLVDAREAEQFYLQALTEFRCQARAACMALAAHSPQFARFGCAYELPEKAQELTPSDLAKQLGDGFCPGAWVFHFDNEGGFNSYPSEN